MKSYHAKDIRNVAIVGHNSVGKTLLTESMAYYTGTINRLGSIDDGTTISDYSAEEIEKKYSIRSSLISLEFNKTKLNILDCPGYADFIGETYGAIRVADSVLITTSATNAQGTEVGSENGYEISKELNKPVAFFVNKCDSENADYNKVVADLTDSFSSSVTKVQIPVGKGDNFTGIIDLISMKLFEVENGKKVVKDIPADMADEAQELREALVENIAGTDEDLMEKFFEDGDLSPEDFDKGFKNAFKEGLILPVFCGSALKQIGVASLMENFNRIFLSPLENKIHVVKGEEELEYDVDETKPFSAFIFKTVSEAHVGDLSFFKVMTGSVTSGADVVNDDHNEKMGKIEHVTGKNRSEASEVFAGDIAAVVKLKNSKTFDTLKAKGVDYKIKPLKLPSSLIWEAVQTKDKKDEAKIGQALTALSNEDPTFISRFDPELKQTIIEGQGIKHISTILMKLNDRYGIDIDTIKPKIPYRETITKSVEGSYRHKKQSGGKGQFAEVHFKMRPRERGEGFNFVDAITQGSIPARFIPAVEKGILETLPNGVISGSKVIDLEVELFFGKFHDVDSSEMAFKIASWTCFKNLFREAKPMLLEPIYEVVIVAPEAYTGDIMGDISSKRGRPEGMESKGSKQVITAKIPLSELYGYSTTLRSMTQGKASFTLEYSHYDVVPHDVQERIVQEWAESDKGDEE
ncbi:MAG: elongation factor G [Candidatus Cloacimonadota bacterium]|nr:MAG: elongation factor G [Candidatus Cloacimonadota bacterium]PIE79321.1 MAG: elongation factor G [Candidatus Delongbacteria bacterium]